MLLAANRQQEPVKEQRGRSQTLHRSWLVRVQVSKCTMRREAVLLVGVKACIRERMDQGLSEGRQVGDIDGGVHWLWLPLWCIEASHARESASQCWMTTGKRTHHPLHPLLLCGRPVSGIAQIREGDVHVRGWLAARDGEALCHAVFQHKGDHDAAVVRAILGRIPDACRNRLD